MSNYPTPQIIIGKPSTGQQGDSSAQAYNKYNIHTHAINQTSNPLLLEIKPGFFVSGVNENGFDLFTTGTQVLSIDKTQVVINSYPLLTSTNSTIYFTDNTNSSNVITLTTINVQNINSFITLPASSSGILSSSQSTYLPVTNFNGFINLDNPLTNKVFPLILKNINKAYLHKLDLQLLSSNNADVVSSDISLLIDNVNILNYSILGTSSISIPLDLNTTTYSGLLNVDASFKLFVNSLNTLESAILLAYNLYLYRV